MNDVRAAGRGLAALIGEIDRRAQPQEAAGRAPIASVPIEFLSPNPRNPRRNFAEAELDELAQSIREQGIVQPVVVRPCRRSRRAIEIIAGERRWRAAQRAGLHEIPVIIRDVDDRDALELAIIENVQRADLNPVEEALGYQQLIDEHGYTQADLGQIIGKSRSHVANTLRLLKLPDPVRDMIVDGSLSAGHARTLVNAEDPAALAGASSKAACRCARPKRWRSSRPAKRQRPAARRSRAEKDADTMALEKLLSDASGLKVVINHKDKGGEVRIAYRTLEQLDELCRRLQR